MLLLNDFPRVAAFVSAATDCTVPSAGGAAIGWLRDDELLAGVLYEDFTGSSITATIAVAPGAVLTKEFVRAIFTYPFVQLGCGKMLALIHENNWRSHRLVKHMGFEVEAVIADYYPDGALNIYTMTKADCRWLEKEHGEENQNT